MMKRIKLEREYLDMHQLAIDIQTTLGIKLMASVEGEAVQGCLHQYLENGKNVVILDLYNDGTDETPITQKITAAAATTLQAVKAKERVK